MLTSFWNSLTGLTGGAATFVGSVIGFVFGSITLVLGALFNAHLNRRRDDRLRSIEIRAALVGIRAEFQSQLEAFEFLQISMKDVMGDFWLPDPIPQLHLLSINLKSIGYTETDSLTSILESYYIIEMHAKQLALSGEEKEALGRKAIRISRDKAPSIAKEAAAIQAQLRSSLALLTEAITKL